MVPNGEAMLWLCGCSASAGRWAMMVARSWGPIRVGASAPPSTQTPKAADKPARGLLRDMPIPMLTQRYTQHGATDTAPHGRRRCGANATHFLMFELTLRSR